MASTSGVWTFPYTGTGLTWTNRQPPSFAPNPSSSILTCATLGTKLYAVSQGNSGGVPAVFSIDMSSAQWDWQRVQLVTTSGSNLTSVPTPSSGRGDSSTGGASKGKLSSGAIAAIVVVVILAILAVAFGFYWRRKRNQKKGLDTMEMEKGVPPATVTVSPPPLSPAATVSANYSSVYPPRPNPAGNVPITGPLHPVVARDWSDGSMISNTSHPQPQQQQQPYGHAAHPSTQGVMPVESTTITTVGMPSMYAPTSPTLMTSPVRTQIIAGDKQELGHDEDVSSYMTPTPTSGSFLQPNAPVVSSPASGSSTAGPDPRLQGMMSPALANAQLILQQSQSSTSVNKRPDGNYR
ncbi:hypothetical protein B0O80DRAFT_25754 [Mortierella sp. GBAus27b]|nr:hypothetical protein B0O80DRAFT_25754 [Mortierella sp. GBAus27b]